MIEVRIERVFEIVIGDTSAKLSESEARDLETCLAVALATPAKAAPEGPSIKQGTRCAWCGKLKEPDHYLCDECWDSVSLELREKVGDANSLQNVKRNDNAGRYAATAKLKPAADAEKPAAKAEVHVCGWCGGGGKAADSIVCDKCYEYIRGTPAWTEICVSKPAPTAAIREIKKRYSDQGIPLTTAGKPAAKRGPDRPRKPKGGAR
jgi:hypothetical protein